MTTQDKPVIRALREATGKTQRQVAEELGVGLRNYIRWECGHNLPDALNLVHLADYFGVHPKTLVPYVGKPSDPGLVDPGTGDAA